MSPTPRERERAARTAEQWRHRAVRAAEGIQERTGLRLDALTSINGLWIPLEDAEAFLGISPTLPTPPAPETPEEAVSG